MNILKAREEIMIGKSIYDMNLRVVDYGRVSTDKEEQKNSLDNQINYFNDFIKGIDKWKHVASYIDEGLSGTQVKKREQFLKMIEDAKNGKFDLILTKEVSRFARNTIDSIKYTELLLSYGVIVYFITDNINTIYKDSEFRLTLMASMAQDEVRKLSERVKFGIKRSVKDGKIGGGSLYGYNKKNSKLTIIDEEAKVVKKIYLLYSEGLYGLKKIGEILAKEGYYTRKGNIFSDVTLKKMIKNPRYKGWYTANLSEIENYKTHKRIYKNEKEWIIYKDDRIPAIVPEELWDKANNELNKRNKKIIYNEQRKYTSKIICFEHNKPYIRSSSGNRKKNPVWQCNEYLRKGIKGCNTPRLFEKNIDIIFSNIIKNEIDLEKIMSEIINDYQEIINNLNKDKPSYERKIIEFNKNKNSLLDLLLKNIITKEEYIDKRKLIDNKINILNKNKNLDNKEIINKIKEFIKNKINIENNIEEYFNIFIKKVLVHKIKDDKKKVRLQIIFNYNRNDFFYDL